MGSVKMKLGLPLSFFFPKLENTSELGGKKMKHSPRGSAEG